MNIEQIAIEISKRYPVPAGIIESHLKKLSETITNKDDLIKTMEQILDYAIQYNISISEAYAAQTKTKGQ